MPKTSEVLFRMCANTDPQRDSTIITNPSDSLDHAPNLKTVGSHLGLDATRKLRGEGYDRPSPELVRKDDLTQKLVDQLRNKTERRPRASPSQDVDPKRAIPILVRFQSPGLC